MRPDPNAPKLTPKPAEDVITWKNPDFNSRLRKWGECQEYFTADVAIDPKTGKGTIQLRKP